MHAKTRGLTLIEVLIAITLLAIAGVMLGYFSTSFSATRGALMDTKAQTFARSYIDTLRARWAAYGDYTRTLLPGPGEVPPPQGYRYTITVYDDRGQPIARYTYQPGQPPPSVPSRSPLKTVELEVTAPDGRTLRFVTQLAAPPEGG